MVPNYIFPCTWPIHRLSATPLKFCTVGCCWNTMYAKKKSAISSLKVTICVRSSQHEMKKNDKTQFWVPVILPSAEEMSLPSEVFESIIPITFHFVSCKLEKGAQWTWMAMTDSGHKICEDLLHQEFHYEWQWLAWDANSQWNEQLVQKQ